jgi:hypothetical protein
MKSGVMRRPSIICRRRKCTKNGRPEMHKGRQPKRPISCSCRRPAGAVAAVALRSAALASHRLTGLPCRLAFATLAPFPKATRIGPDRFRLPPCRRRWSRTCDKCRETSVTADSLTIGTNGGERHRFLNGLVQTPKRTMPVRARSESGYLDRSNPASRFFKSGQ